MAGTGLDEPLPAADALALVEALGPADLADVFAVPLLAVDLDRSEPDALRALAARRPPLVLVGAGAAPAAGAEGLDVVLPEVEAAGGRLSELVDAVAAQPVAAVALCGLLRYSAALGPVDALVAESFAYSTLLAGAAYARWLADRRPLTYRPSPQPLLVRREGRRLRLVLNRPDVRNAYDTGTRDALVAALRAAGADPDLDRISLEAVGPAFGAGGDLSQFGTTPDPALAHLIRTSAAPGAEIVRNRHPVTAYLHGACVGAGIEIPAFAERVVATPDTVVALPEVAMGLIPGAGGTASLVRRIGRRRTTWLVLAGARMDAETALRWGLVDEIAPTVPSG